MQTLKIKTLFNLTLLVFVLLAALWIGTKQSIWAWQLVPVTFLLAGLFTQWYIPLTCGKCANYLIKNDFPRGGELVAKIGVAIGAPGDAQYSRLTNLPRHLTPTFTCANYLRIALLTQGKFVEMKKIEDLHLQLNKDEGGTVEGSGRTKAQIAATMHKLGDTAGALTTVNEAITELGQVRFAEENHGLNSDEYIAGRTKVNAVQTQTALFTRASILESIRCYDEALSDRLRALKMATQTYGEGARETTAHMVMLGKLYVKLKKFELALPLLQSALEIRKKTLKASDKLICSAELALADYYGAAGELEKAEKFLLPAFKISKNRDKISPGPAICEYYQAMAFLFQKQKRVSEAGVYFTLARESYLKYFPKESGAFYELNTHMIDFLEGIGKSSDAKPLRIENEKILATFEESKKRIAR